MFVTLLIALGQNRLAAAPSGVYLEARTAAVFAGACHLGSQATTQGREALLGWHVEGGSYSGVLLEGVDVAVAIAGDRNLAEKDAAVTSIVYLDLDSTVDQRAAALAWVVKEHGALLGNVLEVKTVALEVALTPAKNHLDGLEHFRLAAGDEVELVGASLPEGACCKMPYLIGYEPFVPVRDRLVGCAERFRFADQKLARTFERREENDAFFGRFGGI
jgi:hypothetical protein